MNSALDPSLMLCVDLCKEIKVGDFGILALCSCRKQRVFFRLKGEIDKLKDEQESTITKERVKFSKEIKVSIHNSVIVFLG